MGKYIIPLNLGAKLQGCQGENKAIAGLESVRVLYHVCLHFRDALNVALIMSDYLL